MYLLYILGPGPQNDPMTVALGLVELEAEFIILAWLAHWLEWKFIRVENQDTKLRER